MQSYAWNPPVGARGKPGTQSGTHAGQSVDFHDFRSYHPGDDPRHIDWAFYARTKNLSVRLYREEISPRVDILVDDSASMRIEDGRKAQLTHELAHFIQRSATIIGAQTTVHLGARPWRSGHWLEEERLPSAPVHGPPQVPALPSMGQRVVLSDFLNRTPPKQQIQRFAAGAASLVVLMVLGPWESAPVLEGSRRLIDSESGEEFLLRLNRRTIKRYLARLAQLRGDLRAACRTYGATLVPVVADASLADCLRHTLSSYGLVTTARR